jgi:hypothetical protein
MMDGDDCLIVCFVISCLVRLSINTMIATAQSQPHATKGDTRAREARMDMTKGCVTHDCCDARFDQMVLMLTLMWMLSLLS